MKSILYVLILAVMLSCQPQENTGTPQIITTTGMIGDAVINIVGDSLSVQALMGPGVDPHLYKATQGDLQKLTNAEMVFYNGLHLEGKMGEILKKLGSSKIVREVSEEIPETRLIKSADYNGAFDPHIWFDVQLWKIAVKTISGTLIEKYPSLKGHFSTNTNNYLRQLDELDKWVKEQVAAVPDSQRVLITAHDAFGYFGKAYDIKVKGLQGISTLSEFGLRDITELVTFIARNRTKAVFVETSVSEKAINAVIEGCRERGVEVALGGSLYSDAMGAEGTDEGTYIGMVRHNVNTIVNALK